MYDEELNEIKKKKLEEFQKKQQIEQIEDTAKKYLTKEAIERYSNIKMAHPELAIKISVLIVNAAQSNQLTEKIDDEKFKKILMQIQPEKNKFRIIK